MIFELSWRQSGEYCEFRTSCPEIAEKLLQCGASAFPGIPSDISNEFNRLYGITPGKFSRRLEVERTRGGSRLLDMGIEGLSVRLAATSHR